MDDQKVSTYKFMEAFDDYALVEEVINPVSVMYNDTVQKDFFS